MSETIELKRNEELEKRFSFHPLKNEEQKKKYAIIRDHGKMFAAMIYGACPDSREKSLALTKLEEAVFWANASISRNE